MRGREGEVEGGSRVRVSGRLCYLSHVSAHLAIANTSIPITSANRVVVRAPSPISQAATAFDHCLWFRLRRSPADRRHLRQTDLRVAHSHARLPPSIPPVPLLTLCPTCPRRHPATPPASTSCSSASPQGPERRPFPLHPTRRASRPTDMASVPDLQPRSRSCHFPAPAHSDRPSPPRGHLDSRPWARLQPLCPRGRPPRLLGPSPDLPALVPLFLWSAHTPLRRVWVSLACRAVLCGSAGVHFILL